MVFEYLPATQSTQSDGPLMPVCCEYFPASQSRQAVTLYAPVALLNFAGWALIALCRTLCLGVCPSRAIQALVSVVVVGSGLGKLASGTLSANRRG